MCYHLPQTNPVESDRIGGLTVRSDRDDGYSTITKLSYKLLVRKSEKHATRFRSQRIHGGEEQRKRLLLRCLRAIQSSVHLRRLRQLQVEFSFPPIEGFTYGRFILIL